LSGAAQPRFLVPFGAMTEGERDSEVGKNALLEPTLGVYSFGF